jgi:hypothetical protein
MLAAGEEEGFSVAQVRKRVAVDNVFFKVGVGSGKVRCMCVV